MMHAHRPFARPSTLAPPLLLTLGLVFSLGCPDGTAPDGGVAGDGGEDLGPGFKEVSFPEAFKWGASGAQFQLEGSEGEAGPVRSNWASWLGQGRGENEQENPEGNGFRTRYVEDIARMAELGIETYKLTVDWARIEPERGVFDEAEIAHLVAVLTAMKAAGIEPQLGLWQFVMPVWVQNTDATVAPQVDIISETDRAVVDDFTAFVARLIPEVKGLVDSYVVINEPLFAISAGYLSGDNPPGRVLAVPRGTQMGLNLVYMHVESYDLIAELDDVDADDDGKAFEVGFGQAANMFEPVTAGNADEEFSAGRISYVFNDWVMNALVYGELDVDLDGELQNMSTDPPEGVYPELTGKLDFVGLQYSGPVKVTVNALLRDFHPLYGQPLFDVADYDETLPHSGSGKEISAAGLRETLEHYAQWGIPLVVTENGTTTHLRPVEQEMGLPIAEPAPEQAAMYLLEHVWEVGRARARGLDIRGYYLRGVVDRFEWGSGRNLHYGAFSVDWSDPDLTRTRSLLGDAFVDVVSAGGVTEALWQQYVLERYPSDSRPNGGLTISEPPYRE